MAGAPIPADMTIIAKANNDLTINLPEFNSGASYKAEPADWFTGGFYDGRFGITTVVVAFSTRLLWKQSPDRGYQD
jgi:hypothetical protein